MKSTGFLALALLLSALAFAGFRYLGEWMFALILTATLGGLILSRKPKFGKKASSTKNNAHGHDAT